MRDARPLLLLASLILALAPAAAHAQEGETDEGERDSLLFAVSAASATVDDDTLVLEGVPLVTFFSDRPARLAGHMTLREFSGAWSDSEDSFAAIPPNAVLSMLSEDAPENVVVELLSMDVDGMDASFTIAPLQEVLPSGSLGPASLFVDGVMARLDGLILNFTPTVGQ